MGTSASITQSGGIVTVTGLTGMAPAAVGGSMFFSGAASTNNNGTFVVATYISATSVTVTNPSSPAGADANNTHITWSLDWDKSQYAGLVEKKITSASSLVTPDTNHGLYASTAYLVGPTDKDQNTQYNLSLTGNTPGVTLPTGLVTYYAMRASCTSSSSGFVTWVNTTGDGAGMPTCSGTAGPATIEATWNSK